MTTQSAPPPRTPGAKRAGDGEYVFDLAAVNHILGAPDYSTANGACVEGDRMIVALMRMPAGTGAEPHSHPNEQWIYILEGTFKAKVGDKVVVANKPGAFGILAIEEMARSRPDGYTLFVGNVSTNAITPVLYKDKLKINFEK